jgi:TnpA family transposase
MPRPTAATSAWAGVTYCNFVSDQHTGFHAIVVPGTLRDSLFVLGGPLEQRTRLEPDELTIDTAGNGDVVFGLFWLLGYQLSPRLRDISDLRYWRLDRCAHYGRMDGVARHRIRPARIERHWEDLLRIAGSLKLGTVRASDLMRTLQSGSRLSRLRQAIAELGRMVKTLYLLAYVSDVDYRRRILVQLNRGERRHALARAVFFGRRGQLRQANRQGQEDQLGALGLVVNAIALWNTHYMGKILAELTKHGEPQDPADVARLSPTLHAHINLLGHYRFELPPPVAAGERRAILLPRIRAPLAVPRSFPSSCSRDPVYSSL